MEELETITLEAEIDGALKKITVTFKYHGPTNIELKGMHPGYVDELTLTEKMTITSKIVAHKLGHKGIRAV